MFWTLEADTDYLLIGIALAILGAGASIANVPRRTSCSGRSAWTGWVSRPV